MTVKLSPASVLAFVVGLGVLVFLLSGKDLSPKQSVSDAPHSTVSNMSSSDAAWQASRRQLNAPDPSQVVVVQPPTVNVVMPSSSAPSSDATAEQLDLQVAGGWRTPNPAPSMEEEDESSSSDSSEAKPASEKKDKKKGKTSAPASSSGSDASSCDALAKRMHESQDYTGSAEEIACFGYEDDPRVGLALDYGQTESSYAASESVDHPGSYNCMKTADKIVSYGWTGSSSEVSCFGSEDNLSAINEAYGALEEGRSSY